MISQITSALSSGFTTKQVIDFILKKFPDHSDKIKSALAAGYTTDQVIKYLTGGKKALNQPEQATTAFEKTRNTDIKRRDTINNGALAVGGLAATAAAAPMAAAALQRAIPASVQALAPTSVPLPSQAALPPVGNEAKKILQDQPIIQPQTPPVEANSIPQSAPTIQPEVKPLDIKSLLKDKYGGFKGKVEDLLKSGNGPEEISGYFRKFASGTVDKIEKESGQSIEKIVEQYISENPPKITTRKEIDNDPHGYKNLSNMGKGVTDKLYEGVFDSLKQGKDTFAGVKDPLIAKAKPAFDKGLIKSPEDLKKFVNGGLEESQPIAKNSTVITPDGLGEVKEIRNGQAIVEVDGKRHKIPEEELESPIFTEDQIADAYDDLMAKIPEQERSGFISWAGYDEDRNVLGFIPRGGKYEELHNITPEEAKLIKEGKGVARTTGENREGLWVAGEDTRGGVISQIIHDRRKKKKTSDQEQLEFDLKLEKPEKVDRGVKPIFDELGYARNLSRQREIKKKQEEKLRKKQLKDEENERKRKRKKQA